MVLKIVYCWLRILALTNHCEKYKQVITRWRIPEIEILDNTEELLDDNIEALSGC